MSNENAPMDPGTAEAVLFSGVYVPSFVEKCAAHGVTFQTEESLRDALDTVFELKKAAQEDDSLVKEAHDALVGVSGEEAPADEGDSVNLDKIEKVANDATIQEALAVLAQQGE